MMHTTVQIDDAFLRAMSHHVLVNEAYRLVLFTIPKVGCTQLIKLMLRLNGAPDWAAPPHYRPDRPFLKNLGVRRVTVILNDPSWTIAAVFRDPAERLLSAYLDKFIQTRGYAANVFSPGGHGMPFAEFLRHVLNPNTDPGSPVGLHAGTDPHWRAQHLVGGIAWVEPRIDVFGTFNRVGAWIEHVLRRVGAWDEYGATGWGRGGLEAIFQTNTDPNRTGAAARITDFYDRETLRAVYRAYAGDIAFASRAGVQLARFDGPTSFPTCRVGVRDTEDRR